LIQLEQKNVIAKGTIDKMSEIAKKAKLTVEAVFNEVQPTCQLKVRGAK
jgi:phenylpyruvate tautomerase PptA (4-oxalocrotonate tautomerase family)